MTETPQNPMNLNPLNPQQTTPNPTPEPVNLEANVVPQAQAEVEPISATSYNSPEPQIVEKIVYKKQKVHGFFRTLTILALVVIGFLMLLEVWNVFSLNINGFDLHLIYPIIIIFSSIVIWSYKGWFGKIFGLILFLLVVVWFFSIWVYTSLNPSTDTKFWSYVAYPFLINSSYSKLYLNSLMSDLTIMWKDTDNFLEGNYWSDRALKIFSGAKDHYQYYSIQEETNLNLLQSYYSTMSLGVESKQALYLYIKNLFSLQNLDLTNTITKNLKIHWAALISDIKVNDELEKLDIESSFADITIKLAKDIGVRLHYKHLLWQLELVDFEQKSKWYFESTNIDSAEKIIDINMRFGFAKTKILWDK